MKNYVISFYGTSGNGMVAYDNTPCISLDMAMIFDSEDEAISKMSELQNEWQSELRIEEVYCSE